jgi:hypothetical protein
MFEYIKLKRELQSVKDRNKSLCHNLKTLEFRYKQELLDVQKQTYERLNNFFIELMKIRISK